MEQNYFDDKDEDPRNIVTCYVRAKDFERYKKSISFSTAANVLKDMIASVEATDIKKFLNFFKLEIVAIFSIDQAETTILYFASLEYLNVKIPISIVLQNWV